MRFTLAEVLAYEAKRSGRQPFTRPPGETEREGKLHDKISAWCDSQWPRWKYVHSRMDQPTTTAKGVPDFVILAPAGRLLLIECKARDGKCSTEQLGWHKEAEMLGHTVHIVRSLEEFIALTQQQTPQNPCK